MIRDFDNILFILNEKPMNLNLVFFFQCIRNLVAYILVDFDFVKSTIHCSQLFTNTFNSHSKPTMLASHVQGFSNLSDVLRFENTVAEAESGRLSTVTFTIHWSQNFTHHFSINSKPALLQSLQANMLAYIFTYHSGSSMRLQQPRVCDLVLCHRHTILQIKF